jgi:hypothetical protein
MFHSLHDARNVARMNFVLPESPKMTGGPTIQTQKQNPIKKGTACSSVHLNQMYRCKSRGVSPFS